MANNNVIHLTNENFENEVLKSDKPVIVDFWASWCGPCRMLAPTIDELANDLEGKVKVAKVDVDDQNELAAKFRIMSIPTVMLFNNGKVVDSAMGARPKSYYVNMVENA